MFPRLASPDVHEGLSGQDEVRQKVDRQANVTGDPLNTRNEAPRGRGRPFEGSRPSSLVGRGRPGPLPGQDTPTLIITSVFALSISSLRERRCSASVRMEFERTIPNDKKNYSSLVH